MASLAKGLSIMDGVENDLLCALSPSYSPVLVAYHDFASEGVIYKGHQ